VLPSRNLHWRQPPRVRMRAEPVYENARGIRSSVTREAVREQPLAEARTLVEARQSTVSLSPSSLRALQRTSGNRAVGALLRRQPTEGTKADARTVGSVSATIIMDDHLGVFPLLSFSEEKDSEVHVEVPSTTLDTELMRYMLQGIKIEHVTISTTSFNLELGDVLITSFVRSGQDDDVVEMTLNFRSRHLK
jgi:hypothetical protein